MNNDYGGMGPSEGKGEIAGTSECRFTKTPTGDTRRCCTYYPYRRHTSLLQNFRLLLSLPYRRHTSLLPGPLDTPTPGSSLEEGRPSVRTCTWGGSCRLAGREH